MKAAKVAIAALVVAALFIAVPFASVASDAAWSDDNEKAVYYEADTDKLKWATYLAMSGKTSEDFAKDIMKISGFDNRDSYAYSDFDFKVTEWYMGEASSLGGKEITYVKIIVQTVEFKFTAKAGADGNMFVSQIVPYTSEVNDYLKVDGKVQKNDTLTLSGSYSVYNVKKTVDTYKDFDDTFTGKYSNEEYSAWSISLDSSIKFVRDTTEKDYGYTFVSTQSNSASKVYDIGDAEKLTTDQYAYVQASSEISGSAVNFNIENKDYPYVPSADSKPVATTGYEVIEKKYSSGLVNENNIQYKNLVGTTSLSEEQLKTILSENGTTSQKYSDVNNAYENFVNPAEEVTETNQALFFGIFIAIFVIIVVVALIYRERNSE